MPGKHVLIETESGDGDVPDSEGKVNIFYGASEQSPARFYFFH